ncbi:MAG: spoIIIJ-associated protein, partial [Actinomycetota bacterium]|nr:spoIIIJ-associated protein [Actinomycetota bacterium]
MEWIEVSARTLDEARELALDRLGVVGDELEYEIIDEPRGGLFGLGRTDARIRARVKPLSREKPPDRRRRRSTERRPSGSSRKPRGETSSSRGG